MRTDLLRLKDFLLVEDLPRRLPRLRMDSEDLLEEMKIQRIA